MLYFKMSCVYCFELSCVYCCHLMCICCTLCVLLLLCVYCCYSVFTAVTLCVLLLLCVYCSFYYTYMPDCWLEVSIRKVLRPATSTEGFLGFSVPKIKC